MQDITDSGKAKQAGRDINVSTQPMMAFLVACMVVNFMFSIIIMAYIHIRIESHQTKAAASFSILVERWDRWEEDFYRWQLGGPQIKYSHYEEKRVN